MVMANKRTGQDYLDWERKPLLKKDIKTLDEFHSEFAKPFLHKNKKSIDEMHQEYIKSLKKKKSKKKK